jgi:holin-like protein
VGRRLIRSLTRLRQDRLIAKSFPRGDLPMIASLSLILLCQLAGEVIVRGLGLPMPGPVLGLLFLLLLLLGRDRFVVLARGPLQGDGVENASRGLLANLSLLFVPAGVGVVQKLDLVAAHGIAIAAVLAISVVVTLLVTVATFLVASRLLARASKTP